MLSDALEHLIRGIVSHPDDVTVKDKELRRGRMLEVRVSPEDVGKVIGRSGRTATALRTVIGALAGSQDVRIDFIDVDKVGRPRQQENVVNVGKHPRCERPQQRARGKARTQQDGRRHREPHRQAKGLSRHHLPRAARRNGLDSKRCKRCRREQLERDPLQAGDMTSEMGVVDIDRHVWS